MKNFKLGLQMHSVREAFASDTLGTLKRVREMGYTGVEIPMGSITTMNEGLTDRSAEFLRSALAEADLECYGLLTSWAAVRADKIDATIDYNRRLGSGFLVIGSIPQTSVTNAEEIKSAIDEMLAINERLKAEGIVTGYHNHDSDFFNVIDGKPFFEYVFDNTPDDFVMLLDTGNALAGGYESIPLFEKYPNRSPYLHVKGYSKEKGYLAYIGQDDFDWEATLKTSIEVGGAKVFDVEFGKRSDYDPFERAKAACDYVGAILEKLDDYAI